MICQMTTHDFYPSTKKKAHHRALYASMPADATTARSHQTGRGMPCICMPLLAKLTILKGNP